MILMEPVNSLKTIILANKISKYIIAIQSKTLKTGTNIFIFLLSHLLILTFKSVFKGLGRVTENFVIICKRQTNYFENIFFT